MNIEYNIKHKYSRYIVYKDDVEIGYASTKLDAQKIIEEDKAKRCQYVVTWISKSDPVTLKISELEAKNENQAKIKVQQFNMDDFGKILRVERVDE